MAPTFTSNIQQLETEGLGMKSSQGYILTFRPVSNTDLGHKQKSFIAIHYYFINKDLWKQKICNGHCPLFFGGGTEHMGMTGL